MKTIGWIGRRCRSTPTSRVHDNELRVEELKDASELPRYREPWTELLLAVERSSPFQAYEWITAWLECFWKEKPIAFLFLWRGADLIGLAPLLREKEGTIWCRRAVVLPINWHAKRVEFLHRTEPSDVVNAVVSYFLGKERRVKLAFPQIDAAAPATQLLSEIAKLNGLGMMQKMEPPSPIIRVRDGWEEYLKSRSRHLRSELRRKSRKLSKAGAVRVEVISTVSECERGMNDVLCIERNSWKEKLGSSFTAQEDLTRLYTSFALSAAEKGWLRIYVMYLESTPIAHIYGVVHKNEYYALKTSYDSAYQRLSPGVVIFERALSDLFDQKIGVIDFLGEESRWKNELANDSRNNVDVCIYSRSHLRCSFCTLYNHYAKPFIKRRLPWLPATLKRMQALRSVHSAR